MYRSRNDHGLASSWRRRPPVAFAAGVARAVPGPHLAIPDIKVCGVVTPDDAKMILRCAHEELPSSVDLFIGMIIWPGSRRSVPRNLAREIAAVATAGGATPVGVFVNETSAEIAEACIDLNIPITQLHGSKCRRAVLMEALPTTLSVVDVADVLEDGSLVDRAFADECAALNPLWRLYDSKGGGSGLAFNWTQFRRPGGNWFLAGGLNPENVFQAVRTLQPSGLDVASGVSKEDGCRKDERRVRDFLSNARRAAETLAVSELYFP
jgi:phosphoribosylanthranilate isomerase